MVKDKLSGFKPDIAIPPGKTLLETIKKLGMSQKELAERMERPKKTINEIIHGKTVILPETAIQLERVLGIPADFWLRLEDFYQETKVRLKEEQRLKEEIVIFNKFNKTYTEVTKLGFLPLVKDRMERIKNTLKFFGVNSLKLIPEFQNTAFRVAKKRNYSPYAMAAWLRMGEIEAQKIETKILKEKRIRQLLKNLRKLAQDPAGKILEQIIETGKEYGIAFVFIPHLPNTYVNGATKWIKTDKALVQLSFRYPYLDVFLFSLFHELGHIYLHSKKQTFIDIDMKGKDKSEREANDFASEILIPPDKYKRFIRESDFSKSGITKFAKEVKIHPGIIVGRLQHDQKIQHSQLNSLRLKFTWN
jgi:HTH-type transcriptional regulator/antitoxin HigA